MDYQTHREVFGTPCIAEVMEMEVEERIAKACEKAREEAGDKAREEGRTEGSRGRAHGRTRGRTHGSARGKLPGDRAADAREALSAGGHRAHLGAVPRGGQKACAEGKINFGGGRSTWIIRRTGKSSGRPA